MIRLPVPARAVLVGLICALAALPARAERIELTLPTGSTLQAELEVPAAAGTDATPKKHPAVIYVHGAIVRTAGYDKAADAGYDVADFTRAFAQAGFVALAPLRVIANDGANGDDIVAEGLSSVLAASAALRARDDVDPQRISVAGFSEGGLIALWALARMPDLRSGVVMSPASMDGRRGRAATLGFATFLKDGAVKAIRAPLLLTVGEEEPRSMRRRTDRLAETLIKSYKRFRYIHTYRGNHRWFRQPQPEVMADIVAFLKDPAR